jgi:hypothetical protein
MKPNLFRHCRRWLLFGLLLPLYASAQIHEGNYIIITFQEQTYNCATGEAYVRFHITNFDQYGNISNSHTVYSIDLGISRVIARSLPSGDADVWFTGAYHPGDDIVCSAQGISDNDAPETEFRFVGTVPPPPAVPVISANSSMPLCNGASVVLTASGSTGMFFWSDGSDGNTLTTAIAGIYTVHAVGDCGVSAESAPFVVSVASSPAAPVIGSSNGTLLCNGSTTTFTATSSGGTINWSNGATGTSFSTATAGTYYASETNGCGTSGNSNVIAVSVSSTPSAPTVISSNGMSLCNGSSTTLSTTPSFGGSIGWNTGATGNSILVSSPGNYYAVESNSCGTSGASNVVSISTGSAPSAPSVSSSNGTLLCNGASTVLSASGGGSVTWNTGDVNSSIGVSTAGTYYAVASNNCGTSGQSNSIVIATSSTPGAPSVSSSAGTLLCNGASTVLSASPSYGGAIHWSTGASGNTLSVSSTGTYYAYESNGCGNGAISNSIAITTSATPASPGVTPSGNQQLCNGASVTLSSSGTDVLWSNGAAGNTITVSASGDYYTVDRNACGNSAASNVVAVTTVVCPTPVPGGSFLVCPGTMKTLDAGAGYDSYEWSNGATTRTVAVVPGTYTVTVSKQGCFATSAAVTVGYYTVTTPTITASGATTFCAGGSVNLSVSAGNAFAWNTGANSASINVSSSGAYYVSVTDANGCVATSAAVNVNVHELPVASISGNAGVCQSGSSPAVVFTASGGVAPYTFSYTINGGAVQNVTTVSGNSVSVAAPTGTAGNFVYALVGVQESSSTACSNAASGSVTIAVNALPTASIAGNTTVCKNSASPLVVFTANGGSGPYTFTYTINGGANQVISSVSGNSVSLPVPTASVGTFVYSLVSVQEAGSCAASASGSVSVTVNELPTATISGSATVCQGAASPVVSFTGAGGIAPYTFSYRINGGPAQTITTVSGNSVDLSVPTTTAGVYVYELLSVQESSGTSCMGSASGSVTVSVHALPTATISGDATVCKNAASPLISFSGSGGVAPYTFSYRINGGSVQTITGNSVSVPTSVAGSFVYSLVSVQEASGNSCAAAASGTATVVVNPLPTATISGSATVCQNSGSPVVTFAGANGTAPYTFTYRVNAGTDQTIVATGNTATLNVPTSTAGTFIYSLLNVNDAGCSNAASGSASVIVNPQPAKAVVTASNTHLCNGETGVLTINNYVSGYTYHWYKDGVLIRSSIKDTIVVSGAGSYTVLPVSAEGCEAGAVSDALIITTGSVTTPVITGSLKVCEGGQTMLAVSGDHYDRWRWSSPPGMAALSEDSSFFAGAGQYRVWVSTNGCADSVNVAVTADDTEFPAGRLITDKAIIAYGETVRFTADVVGAAKYQWNLGNGRNFSSGSNTITENYFLSGDSIPVKVWATSARNCTTLFTTSIKVGAMVVNTLPDRSFTGTVKDWNVFPIPFHDKLRITAILKRNETVRIDLFAPDGKWVRSWTKPGVKGENLFTLDGLEVLSTNVLYYIVGFYNGEKHFDKIYKY